MLASDDLATLQGLIDASQGNDSENKLNTEPVFVEARKQLENLGDGQLEYFARPWALQEYCEPSAASEVVTRPMCWPCCRIKDSILSRLSWAKSSWEPNASIWSTEASFSLAATKGSPRRSSDSRLPNEVSLSVPNFISDKVSTVVSVCWNVKDAFWKAEGLVDAMAGQKDVFKEIIEGIKVDPTGPKIDIRKEVMPLLTNEIYAVSDATLPLPSIPNAI